MPNSKLQVGRPVEMNSRVAVTKKACYCSMVHDSDPWYSDSKFQIIPNTDHNRNPEPNSNCNPNPKIISRYSWIIDDGSYIMKETTPRKWSDCWLSEVCVYVDTRTTDAPLHHWRSRISGCGFAPVEQSAVLRHLVSMTDCFQAVSQIRAFFAMFWPGL